MVMLAFVAGLGGCATASAPDKPATVVEVVEMAKKQYPDINFDVPAPVEVTFSGGNDEVWRGIADTLTGMNEQLAVVDKQGGVMRTVKNNLNQESWVRKGLGKATYLYEFDITLRPGNKGVIVRTNVPFWEEKILGGDEQTSIPAGANMMRHIFYWNMAQKAKPLFEKMSDQPDQDIAYVPSKEMSQAGDGKPVPEAHANAVPMPDMSTKQGVKQVQQRLADLGYKPGSADGIMSKRTARALRMFQRDNRLPETGMADSGTLQKLFSH